jgi:hypothetical protein
MQRRGIDLPEPEGPHRTIFSPARTVKLMSFNALNESNHFSNERLAHLSHLGSGSPLLCRFCNGVS